MEDSPLVVGIDVAASRPSVVVALQGDRRRLDVVAWREVDEREPGDRARCFQWLETLAPVAVAVAAAQRPRRATAESPARVADAQLLRRRIAVTPAPTRAQAERGGPRTAHIQTGWAYFRDLRGYGFESPAANVLPGALGQAPSALEVYPHAGFVTLLGGTPPSKATREGLRLRVATLRRLGVRWDEYYDAASLDALMAAFTAWRFVQGLATSLGDDRQGRVWLPVTASDLRDTYAPLSSSAARDALASIQPR
ncbi:MAG: DUF429 domain-containing protein [Thermoleophilia bacterium]